MSPLVRRAALLAAALLLLQAAWALLQRAGDLPPREPVTPGSVIELSGVPYAFAERVLPDGRVTLVVSRAGEEQFSTPPLYPVPGDAGDALAGRVQAAAGPEDLVIITVDSERSGIDAVAWQRLHIDAAGNATEERRRADPVTARGLVEEDLIGRAPRTATLWPPPAGVIAGLWLLAYALVVPRGVTWSATCVVFGVALVTSVLTWPFLETLTLRRSLPPALVAFAAALLAVRLGAGRAVALMRGAGRVRSLLVGALFGLAVFAVFTGVAVAVNGFLAPVFCGPVSGPSPMALFVADYIAPALGIGSVGALPALLAGAVYGLWQRGRTDTA